MQLNDKDDLYYAEQLGTLARITKTDHSSMILQTVGGLHYIALDATEQDGTIRSSLVERATDQAAAERMLSEYHSQPEQKQRQDQAKHRLHRR